MFLRYLTTVVLLLLLLIQGCDNEDSNPDGSSKITSNDFLSDRKYDKLIVEIQYVNGFKPTTEAIDNLKSFLQQRLNKPAGITVVENSIASPGKSTFTLAELQNLEKSIRTQQTKDKTLTAYFLFADGDYAGSSGNSKVLGIAYGTSSMVIFEKTIRDFSGGIGQPPVRTLETTVVLHEFGHILGLVNNGTAMQTAHQDSSHGKHCTDQNCLMYFTAETSDIVANIVGGNVPQLDANCLNDLKANGGK